MTPSPKRITRKELRRPDQFVTLTQRSLQFALKHKKAFVLGLICFFVGVFAFTGWRLYRERQERAAGQAYSRALSLYHEGKYGDALGVLKELESHRLSIYGRLALIYQANSYIALNDPTRAVQALEKFLQRERSDSLLRQLAYVTLGHAQEKAGHYKKASLSFSEAEKLPGPFKDEASLARARVALQGGDLKGALASYQQFLKAYPAHERTAEVSLKVQELEAKLEAPQS